MRLMPFGRQANPDNLNDPIANGPPVHKTFAWNRLLPDCLLRLHSPVAALLQGTVVSDHAPHSVPVPAPLPRTSPHAPSMVPPLFGCDITDLPEFPTQFIEGHSVNEGPTPAQHVAYMRDLAASQAAGKLPDYPGQPRELHLSNGDRLFMSPPVETGGFSKFRLACDTLGNRWAVKELSLCETPPERLTMYVPTEPRTVTLEQVKLECKWLRRFSPNVEIREIAHVGDSVFVVMPVWSGDLTHAVPFMSDAVRAAFARAAGMALVTVLKRCHSNGVLHQDVKLANVVFNATGEVALIDYNSATKMHQGNTTCAAGTVSYMAPEMIDVLCCVADLSSEAFVEPDHAAALGHALVPYDAKVETWSLGWVLAEILAGTDGHPMDAPFPQRAQIKLAEFATWHAGLLSQNNTVDMRRLNASAQATPWDVFFRRVQRADATLCAFILQHMLVPAPQQRCDMNKVEHCLASEQLKHRDDSNRIARELARLAALSERKRASRWAIVEAMRKSKLWAH